MNVLEEAVKTYRNGRIVQVDESVVGSHLRAAEGLLGLEPWKYSYDLQVFPNSVFLANGVMGGTDFRIGKITLSDNAHEATILHEAIHYVMGKRGLFLSRTEDDWAWYGRLVNETFAETATVQVYGQRNPKIWNINERTKDIKNLRDLERECQRFPGIDSRLVLMHNFIERKYAEKTNDRELKNYLERFLSYLESNNSDENKREISMAIATLASSNAGRLVAGRVPLKRLAYKLARAIKKGEDPFKFYFDNIVPFSSGHQF